MLLSFLLVFSFGTSAFAASIGDVLTTPEDGWERYDDTSELIKYNGGQWVVGTGNKLTYEKTHHQLIRPTSSQSVSFTFHGTKFRIISVLANMSYPDSVDIYIDGIKADIMGLKTPNGTIYQVLAYEKTNLQLSNHTVEIVQKAWNDAGLVIDAIDVDGKLIDPNAPIPDPEPQPEPTGDRAILTVTMTTGLEKEFVLSMSEVNDFINWYDAKENGSGPARYGIDKHNNNKGPFSKRVDYVIFKNILSFEVDEYTLSK